MIGKLESGSIHFADDAEACPHGFSNVPLASCSHEVAGLLEALGKDSLGGRDGPVELLGIRLVGVSTGKDTGSAGRTGTDGEEGMVEAHPLGGEAIEVWGLHGPVPEGAKVIPAHVVGENDDEVGPLTALPGSCRYDVGHEDRGEDEGEKKAHGERWMILVADPRVTGKPEGGFADWKAGPLCPTITA